MKTVYAIASLEHRCFGHGDYGDVLSITVTGPYGTGEFAPVYATRELAERNNKYGVVVPLKVIEEEPPIGHFRKVL